MSPIDPYTQRERGPSPGLTALRNFGAAMRRMRLRRGQAQSQALIWLGVIIGIAILSAGAYGAYRLIVSGAEDTALKDNIDRVAQEADIYWTSFAQDRHGRRSIDMVRFCTYANSKFSADEGITLRTLALADGTAVANDSTDTDAANTIDFTNDDEIAERVVARLRGLDDSAATCPDGTTEDAAGSTSNREIEDFAYADIVVGDDNPSTPTLTGASSHTAAFAPSLGTLENVGLGTQNAVWMAQYDWAAAGDLPDGTRGGFTQANEVLVFGGISPSGNSYCLVKVFDADNRAQAGEYRIVQQGTGDAARTPFAVCTGRIDTDQTNAGWPG